MARSICTHYDIFIPCKNNLYVGKRHSFSKSISNQNTAQRTVTGFYLCVFLSFCIHFCRYGYLYQTRIFFHNGKKILKLSINGVFIGFLFLFYCILSELSLLNYPVKKGVTSKMIGGD